MRKIFFIIGILNKIGIGLLIITLIFLFIIATPLLCEMRGRHNYKQIEQVIKNYEKKNGIKRISLYSRHRIRQELRCKIMTKDEIEVVIKKLYKIKKIYQNGTCKMVGVIVH